MSDEPLPDDRKELEALGRNAEDLLRFASRVLPKAERLEHLLDPHERFFGRSRTLGTAEYDRSIENLVRQISELWDELPFNARLWRHIGHEPADLIGPALGVDPGCVEPSANGIGLDYILVLRARRLALLIAPTEQLLARVETTLGNLPRNRAIAARSVGINDARDKWIYERCCSGIPLKVICNDLKGNTKGWSNISTIQGIKAAALRYAKRHGLVRWTPLSRPKNGDPSLLPRQAVVALIPR